MEKSSTTVEAIESRLKDQFHIEMDIYQISENSMICLDLMGLLMLGKKVVVGTIVNQRVRLPVDALDVKLVTYPRHLNSVLPNQFQITVQEIYFPPQIVFTPIPSETDEIALVASIPDLVLEYIDQVKGPYIDFVWEPPFVKLNTTDGQVVILYTTVPIDKETGLANIPYQAFEACIYYNLFIYYQPLFITGKVNPNVFAEITKWKNQKMNQGKFKYGMSQLSQNEMSKLHSIQSSFDRKSTNRDS